uniref:Uncharacterized protein n=1 Tax=Podoviridae sp. ctsNK10 TaxID=2826582 RepID=A0A8S5NM15_9CAUD|nr:MAG TPA: hypothetical protein [Podoviridae sp. ctsNK10]
MFFQIRKQSFFILPLLIQICSINNIRIFIYFTLIIKVLLSIICVRKHFVCSKYITSKVIPFCHISILLECIICALEIIYISHTLNKLIF